MAAPIKTNAIPGRDRAKVVRTLIAKHGCSRPELKIHPSDNARDDDHSCHTNRIVNLLRELGPIFRAFGRYVASRADLMVTKTATGFSSLIDDRPDTIRSLEQLLGRAGAEELRSHCSEIHETPFDCGEFSHRFSGRLRDGQSVEIKAVRALEADDNIDLELLEELRGTFTPLMLHASGFSHATADFCRVLANQLDCRRLGECLETLGYERDDFPSLRIPQIKHNMLTPRVIVMERIEGTRLDDLRIGLPQRDAPARRCDVTARVRELWIELATRGSLMPVEMRSANILACSDGSIAFVDGEFEIIPSNARVNLQAYLSAVAMDNTRDAAKFLMQEFDSTQTSISQEELFRQLRQHVAPFQPTDATTSHLWTVMNSQWQLLARNGCKPLRHFSSIIRALHSLNMMAGQDGSEWDPLRRSIKGMQSSLLARDLAAFLRPERFMADVDKFAMTLMQFPQAINETLDSRIETTHHHESTSSPEMRSARSGGTWLRTFAVIITLMLLFASAKSESAVVPENLLHIDNILFLVAALLVVSQLRASE